MANPEGEGAGLDEVDRALESLRREIVARFPPSRPESASGLGAEWIRLFDEVRRRLATLGMSERSGEVDEFGMDDVVVRRSRRLFDLL